MDGIAGIASLMLWTSADRFDAMRHFYIDQLGLTPDSDRPGRVAFSWGEPPTRVRLILNVHSEVHGETREPHRLMLNFRVDDARATAERLRAVGVDIEEPREQSWGGMVATFRDPDGNTLQLLEPEAQ